MAAMILDVNYFLLRMFDLSIWDAFGQWAIYT